MEEYKLLTPKNGYYLTLEDFPGFHDKFSRTWNDAYPSSSTKRQSVLNVTFCVTEKCNLACTYCYECHKTGRRMSWETAKKCVDRMLDGDLTTEDCPAVILEFIGGEPLLEIDLIDKIVDYFKAEAFRRKHPWGYYYMISMSSNGVLYNTPKVQEFLRKNDGRVSVSISLDGDKKLHDACRVFHDGTGSYDVVSESVHKLLQENPLASTKVTFAPENLPYMVDAIKHLYQTGYHCIHANPVFENVWKYEDAVLYYNNLVELADWIIDNDLYGDLFTTLFLEQYTLKPDECRLEECKTKAYCGGNGLMLCFGTDGKVYPCLRYMKHSLTKQPERPIGDIELGLYTDKEHTEWFQKLQNVTTWSSADNECRNCPALSLCPTCIAHQYDDSGNPNLKTKYHCEMFKAELRANYYYWTKLYRKLGVEDEVERILPVQEYERKV